MRARSREPVEGAHSDIVSRQWSVQHSLRNEERGASFNSRIGLAQRLLAGNRVSLAVPEILASPLNLGPPWFADIVRKIFIFQAHQQPVRDLHPSLTRKAQDCDT